MTHPKRLGTATGSSGPARALPGMIAPGGERPLLRFGGRQSAQRNRCQCKGASSTADCHSRKSHVLSAFQSFREPIPLTALTPSAVSRR